MVKTLTEERSLYEAIRDNSPHFKDKLSRNLIIFLYQQGCFKPNGYNNFNPSEDKDFLLKMFNKKGYITYNQKAKIKALIYGPIKEYLFDKYEMHNPEMIK